nr:EOG090X04O4 [Ilyocryptus agilis]
MDLNPALLLIIAVVTFASGQDLVIKSADRTVDLTSQLVKITHRLTVSNTGQSAVTGFDFSIEGQENLSYFKAQLSDNKESQLKTTQETKNGILTYRVYLEKPLEAGQSVKVIIGTVFTHQLKPHPAEITQKEKQLVQYTGNAYIYSPYKVTSQTTKVLLSSSNVESFTKVKPSSHSDSTVTYGPYENVAPFSQEKVTVHFENNTPFLSVSSLVRHIEVSHWGNIAVEETLDVYHNGAKLKGSFSRFEYQREQSGVSSVKSFRTLLPELASDVYYRDEIGNISTSNLRYDDDEVVLELRPRFPLFGGWKTHYVIGYNVPSFAYLYNSGNEYVLQMDLVDHEFDNMVIDEALVRIVLPEGVSSIELETPYPVTRLPDSLHFTYLDVKGRPVVEFSAKNLVENHTQQFKLRYTFSRIVMFQEPLLCASAFFTLFLTVIIFARLDFSITKDEVNDNRLRAESLAETVRVRYVKRSGLYHQYEDQIVRLKGSKDLTAFRTVTKNLLTELKEQVADLLPTSFKADHPLLADRLTELQKQDKLYKELQTNHGLLVERLLSSKMSKLQFLESESQILKRKEEMAEKLAHLINTL